MSALRPDPAAGAAADITVAVCQGITNSTGREVPTQIQDQMQRGFERVIRRHFGMAKATEKQS